MRASEKVEEALRHIQVQWDVARTEDNLRLARQRIRRRGRTRVALSALLLGVAIATAVSYRLLPGLREAGKAASVVQDSFGHGLRFSDGFLGAPAGRSLSGRGGGRDCAGD